MSWGCKLKDLHINMLADYAGASGMKKKEYSSADLLSSSRMIRALLCVSALTKRGVRAILFLLSGYSAAGSALALGARCRAFEPPYPDDFYRIYRICSSRLKYA